VRIRNIILALVVIASVSYRATAYDKTYAVVVAIGDYKNFTKNNGDLQYTISDAYAFYNFLKSREGGSVPSSNICLLTDANATKQNIISKSKALFSKAGANDRVIFYFSGHGNSGSFMPYDANSYGSNLLYFSELKEIFRYAKCKTKLIFADACFSGSIKANSSRASSSSTSSSSKINIAVMMSCKDNETSMESSDIGHGLFTYYLIEGLKGRANKDKNEYVTIQELFYYVYQKVVNYASSRPNTKQTPVLFGNFDLRLIVAKAI